MEHHRFKVVVTHPIHPEGIKVLEEIAEVHVLPEAPRSEEELIKAIADADAVLVTLNVEPVTRRVIESAPKLKIIARHGVGYDNVDVKAATERGIWVTIAPVNASTVAEFTIALIFALAHKVVQRDRFIKSGSWTPQNLRPQHLVGIDVQDKILGIVGLGRIGQEVAKRAACLGMKVVYYDVVRRKELEEQLSIEYRDLETLLKISDFVSLHVPLTPQTKHLIGERELKLMKPTAYLINTARGPVVDMNALVRALKEGWIAGAALDVFEEEPLPPNHPLLSLDNVILSPHMATHTDDCKKRVAATAAQEIVRVLKGEKPLYPVNPEVEKYLSRKPQP